MSNIPCHPHMKRVTKEMMAAVKGSRKRLRLKAIILEVLSDGDTLTTHEMYHTIKDGWICNNLPAISTIGTLCQAMPQVEALGRVKPCEAHMQIYGYKPVQTWSLRSLK